MLKIGDVKAEPGQISVGRLDIGELREGTGFGLPVAAVNGVEDGPLLYIQAGSDGNELNGIGVVRNLMADLDPQQLRGGILIVSPLNFHGYQLAKHRNPLDNEKINRTFPGKQEGSISERLSHAVFEYAKESDLVLDLHQGGTSRMINEVRVRVDEEHQLHQECLELAQVFGIEYILDKGGPDGQLARAAPDQGVPTIDPELGGCVGWDSESIELGVQGVLNVLRYYGFLEGEPLLPDSYTVVDDFQKFYAGRGGLVEYEADFQGEVASGDGLFKVTDLFGRPLETVESTVDGIFWRKKRLPMTASGEEVCQVGLNPRKLTFAG